MTTSLQLASTWPRRGVCSQARPSPALTAALGINSHRKIEAAAGFVLSDTLTDTDCTPDFGSPEILRGLEILVSAAIEVIARS